MSHAVLQAVHKGLHGSLDQMMTRQKNKQKKKPLLSSKSFNITLLQCTNEPTSVITMYSNILLGGKKKQLYETKIDYGYFSLVRKKRRNFISAEK